MSFDFEEPFSSPLLTSSGGSEPQSFFSSDPPSPLDRNVNEAEAAPGQDGAVIMFLPRASSVIPALRPDAFKGTSGTGDPLADIPHSPWPSTLLSPCGNMWPFCLATAGSQEILVDTLAEPVPGLTCRVNQLLSRRACGKMVRMLRSSGILASANVTALLSEEVVFYRIKRLPSYHSPFDMLQAFSGRLPNIDKFDIAAHRSIMISDMGYNGPVEMSVRADKNLFPQYGGATIKGLSLGCCRTLSNTLRVGGWCMYSNVCYNIGENTGSVYLQCGQVPGKWWSVSAERRDKGGWVISEDPRQHAYVRHDASVRTVRFWEYPPQSLPPRHFGKKQYYGIPSGYFNEGPGIVFSSSTGPIAGAVPVPIELEPIFSKGQRTSVEGSCLGVSSDAALVLLVCSLRYIVDPSWQNAASAVIVLASTLCEIWAASVGGLADDTPLRLSILRTSSGRSWRDIVSRLRQHLAILGPTIQFWKFLTTAFLDWKGYEGINAVSTAVALYGGATIVPSLYRSVASGLRTREHISTFMEAVNASQLLAALNARWVDDRLTLGKGVLVLTQATLLLRTVFDASGPLQRDVQTILTGELYEVGRVIGGGLFLLKHTDSGLAKGKLFALKGTIMGLVGLETFIPKLLNGGVELREPADGVYTLHIPSSRVSLPPGQYNVRDPMETMSPGSRAAAPKCSSGLLGSGPLGVVSAIGPGYEVPISWTTDLEMR